MSTIGRTAISSPSVWRTSDLANPKAWTVDLDEAQRYELSEVGRAAKAAGLTPSTLTVDDVPLRSMADTVDRIVHDLSSGRGFLRLRGFPVDLLDAEEIELAYVALGLHLGTPVSQDADGTLLGHVRDEGITRTGPRGSSLSHSRATGLPHRRGRHHRAPVSPRGPHRR